MIDIEGLRVKYKNKLALNIEGKLAINKGDKIGIVGLKGAGKTTLINAILNLVNYEGKIDRKIGLKDIAVHMESNNYLSTLKIKHIIEMMSGYSVEESEIKELIVFFEFENCLNKRINQISWEEKQTLTLILVLREDSSLILLDEATNGLEFEMKQKLMKLLKEKYKKKKTTICIVSHHYEVLEALVDKLMIIDNGKIIEYDSREKLFNKYCGEKLILVKNNKKNIEVSKEFKKIYSPEDVIAIPCSNEEMERYIVSVFIKEDIDYRRRSDDIKIVLLNAIRQNREEKKIEK